MPIFQKIIQLLRDCVDDKEVIGSGIFTFRKCDFLSDKLTSASKYDGFLEWEIDDAHPMYGYCELFSYYPRVVMF